MIHVITAHYLDGYRIRLRFSNGAEGVVDLAGELWGPVFDPLKDQVVFKQFELSPVMQTICWPNGADLAPEFLHQTMIDQAGTSSAAGRG